MPDDKPILDAIIICPACGTERALIAEVCERDEDGTITDYGPGIAECCGRMFITQPDGRVEAYLLEGEDG